MYALAATLGGSALAAVLRPALGPLRRVCVLVLPAPAAWGGGHRRAAVPGPPARHPHRGRAAGPARACPALLGITLLNPTTVIYFAALVPGSRSGDAAGFPERAVFVAAAFAASASRQVLLAGGGGRALTGRRGRLATALVASAVMTALALRMAVAAG